MIEAATAAVVDRGWEDPALDVPGAPAATLRYAITGLGPDGATYLCEQFRRRGLGVPFPYLDDRLMPQMAARLGCWDVYGQMDIRDYLTALTAKRTTSNGAFGIFFRKRQLQGHIGDDFKKTLEFWRTFDRIIFMRHRDKVLASVRVAQWRVSRMAPDSAARVRDSEHRVYEMMSEALHGLVAGDAHIKRMAGSLGEDKVRGVDVESLRDPAVVDALAAWIGGDRASPTSAAPTEGFKFDTSAGDLEFKRRFLDYIGATG